MAASTERLSLLDLLADFLKQHLPTEIDSQRCKAQIDESNARFDEARKINEPAIRALVMRELNADYFPDPLAEPEQTTWEKAVVKLQTLTKCCDNPDEFEYELRSIVVDYLHEAEFRLPSKPETLGPWLNLLDRLHFATELNAKINVGAAVSSSTELNDFDRRTLLARIANLRHDSATVKDIPYDPATIIDDIWGQLRSLGLTPVAKPSLDPMSAELLAKLLRDESNLMRERLDAFHESLNIAEATLREAENTVPPVVVQLPTSQSMNMVSLSVVSTPASVEGTRDQPVPPAPAALGQNLQPESGVATRYDSKLLTNKIDDPMQPLTYEQLVYAIYEMPTPFGNELASVKKKLVRWMENGTLPANKYETGTKFVVSDSSLKRLAGIERARLREYEKNMSRNNQNGV